MRLSRWARFARDFLQFRRQSVRARDTRFTLRWNERFPCLDDATSATPFDAHYIYHTAWAARRLAELKPVEHVDISSSLYFNSIVSAFTPIRFYDYRPANLFLPGLSARAGDLLRLPFADHSVSSLSCMHVVEHLGLGRYGDPLDPTADLRAMRELSRVLAPHGSLLFVVPVGQPKIAFNAHRIYGPRHIVDAFPDLQLKEFSLIADQPEHGIIADASFELAERQSYGCGCFHFVAPGSR